jgi:hypothetical protein
LLIFGGDRRGLRRDFDVQLRIDALLCHIWNFGGGYLRTNLYVEFVLRLLFAASSSGLVFAIMHSKKVYGSCTLEKEKFFQSWFASERLDRLRARLASSVS